MATTMEQRAKFRELRLAGTPREDAMKQAYGDLTAPTPTGGATIPITPTVTQPTTPTTQPIAKAGDVVIGVGGEKFVQANNYDGSTNVQGQGQVVNQSGQALNQMQQIQAESFGRREGANIAPIAPVQQTEQQKNAQLGGFIQDNGINSLQPLPKGPTQLPAGTNEPVKAKEISGIDPVLAQSMEDAKNGVYRTPEYYDNLRKGANPTPPPNADMMFSSIVMKAPVPDDQKTTTQYKIAQNRYLKANSYASMTPAQVSSDITSGKLIEGSQTYEDIKSLNPKLIQDANNLRIVNGSKISLYSTDANGNKVNNVEQSFTEDYLGNFGTFLKSLFTVQTPEQIRSAIYTDDVKQAQDKATSIELELNQIEADQAKMEEVTRKELEGTGASAERIRLEIGIRQEKLQNQYNSKLKEYNTYANKANNLITQNTTVYQEQMKQQSAQQQALAGAAGQVFTNELQRQNTLQQQAFQREQTQANQDFAREQAGTQFEQNLVMKQMDYANQEYMNSQQFKQDLQKMKISNQYDMSKMGISNQMDMQKLMAQYNLTNSSNIQASKVDLLSKGFTSDQVDAIMRTATGNWKGATGTSLLSAPDGTIIPTRLSETTNPNGGKECGEYVNDIAGTSLFGNTIEQKKKTANEQDGAIGKAIVWQPSNSPTFKKYGHVGVIIGQNPDGSWKVKSSNIKGDGAISIDDVPQSVALGYKTLPGVKATTQQTSELGTLGQYLIDSQPRGPGFSEDDVKAYTSRINRLVSQGDETGVYKAFRDVLLSDKDLKEQIDTSKKFAGAIDNVQKLLNDYSASGKDTNALKAMAEQVARKLGLTTDEALARLQTQMGFTLADYIRSISGTAASDVEVQRLMGNMANLKNVKELNDVILSQARQNAFTSVKTMIDTRMYGMPEDTKKGVFGDIYSMDSGVGLPNQSSAPTTSNYNFQSDWDNL